MLIQHNERHDVNKMRLLRHLKIGKILVRFACLNRFHELMEFFQKIDDRY